MNAEEREIRLQFHREFVKMLGDLVIAVEALDEVGFAIAIQIPQDGDLIATGDIDLVVDDLEAERLKEAAGDSSPRQAKR